MKNTPNPNLKKIDPTVAKFIDDETKRQQETIDLIASENIVSPAVMEALGSAFTNKYSEGYPGKRYYAGNEVADKVEILARERARKVFGLNEDWHVNVQALSGSPANMAVYYALLKNGDKIMGLSLSAGGHLTHGAPVNFSARFFTPVPYGVTREGFIDFKELREFALKEKPALIVAGITAYSRILDFAQFAKIAKEVDAWLFADVSHISGLIAAGVHPSPFPYADAVMTTTHKSLRGPRGALIFANKKSKIAKKKEIDIAAAIDKAVFPALQGGPHDNQTAAIAVALGEAMKPGFKKYGMQIVKNAQALAAELKRLGFIIVSGGTDNHMMLVDLTPFNIPGKQAQEKLESVGIITNRNAIPFDPRSPFNPSGLRLGTPSVTTRGMKADEMKVIADLLHQALTRDDIKNIQKAVLSLTKKFPIYFA